VHVLRAMEIDPVHLQRALAVVAVPAEPAQAAAKRFSGSAANALELTVTEAIALGHNYVGCEHLLLGLISEPDGAGGQILREAGVDLRSARRAVAAALAGYTHLRAQNATPASASTAVADAVRTVPRPIVDRLDRLERHTGLSGED